MVYTADQANRALPLVRRIVDDVVQTHRRWRDVMRELEPLTPSAHAERLAALEREALGLARELDAFERELDALDVALKDRQMGLVDFPGEWEGRRVWLCWRLGEPSVQYWHELEAGFAGRQPLQPETVP
jgi:hypothetical protein